MAYAKEQAIWIEYNKESTLDKQCEECGLIGYTEKEQKWAGTPRKIIFYAGRINNPWGCQNWRLCQKDKDQLIRQLEVITPQKVSNQKPLSCGNCQTAITNLYFWNITKNYAECEKCYYQD
jgi:hypothetical protein